MCVMSMVYDTYTHWIPTVTTGPWIGPWSGYDDSKPPVDVAQKLKDFQRATAAAAVVDDLTGQKDCVDPDKAKLAERVAELEKLLANPPEFVIVSGGNVTPGTYRVINGKLYKAIE